MGKNSGKREDRTACATPAVTVFACSLCGDCFSSQDYLNQHMQGAHAQKPQRRLKCIYCPYTCHWQSHMTQHERTHTLAKPFSCPSCDRAFSHPHSLNLHQRVHTGERPYPCTVCGRRFLDASGLSSHRKLHLDAGVRGRPHACHLCGSAFRDKGVLTKHLQTHTVEKQHACRVCGQKFLRPTEAKRHERLIHGGQTPSIDAASASGDGEKVVPN
ncbi:uncharacterized protein LOC144138905 isoform X1 [Haemaphysalis longicornis]